MIHVDLTTTTPREVLVASEWPAWPVLIIDGYVLNLDVAGAWTGCGVELMSFMGAVGLISGRSLRWSA